MHAPQSSLGTVRDAWNRVVWGVVRHQANTAGLLDVVQALDPKWVPALCLRGFSLLFLGRRALRDRALAWAGQAKAALDGGAGEPGDEHLVDALIAWARDECWQAEVALRQRLLLRPDCLFTVKLQHGLLFLMGQPEALRDRIESHLERWDEQDLGYGYVLGATVFARVEAGDFSAAQAARERWGEGPNDDAWGLHAVAHLLHERDRHADALEWLDARRARWADCDRFGNHLDWHRALLHLQLGGATSALALFDEHLRGVFDGNYRDMSNAVSILWRLEAMGIDVGSRWGELATRCVELLDDHGSAFADAHYVLAQLHGAGVTAAEAMIPRGEATDGYQATVVREVGVPLCEALRWWRDDPERAREGLRTVMPELSRIGGSHAQRSLFEDVFAYLERRQRSAER